MNKQEQIEFLKAFIALNDRVYDASFKHDDIKIESGTVESALCKLYEKFLSVNGFPTLCAQELLYSLENPSQI